MRKSISILAIVAALFMVCSCQKESTTTLRATINQYNGNNGKVYLANDYVNWHVGDNLWVNGCEATVTGENSPFTVSVPGLDYASTNNFYAVFPKEGSTMNQSNFSATVTIPAVQTYEADADGNQILNAPMAAKQVRNASGVTTLMFYNLASLFEIELPANAVGATIKSIDVYNVANNFGGAAINGTADVSFGDNNVTMGTVDGTHVTKLEVNATHEANRKYYVVVAPVENAQFRVAVTYETANVPSDIYAASVKQVSDGNNLPANRIAPIAISNTNSYLTYVTDGTNNYYISPGNVQCYIADPNVSLPDNATDAERAQYYANKYQYKFADHQWETKGGSNLNTDGSLHFTIDLFPYGQATNPEARDASGSANSDMTDFVNSGIGCDFYMDGVSANYQWMIPHMDKVGQVFAYDGGTYTSNNGHITPGTHTKMATISVGNTQYGGLIVLPKYFPTDLLFASGATSSVEEKVLSAEEWMLYESLGAAFLPTTGQMDNHGGFDVSGTHSLGMGFYTLNGGGNNNPGYVIFNDPTGQRFYFKHRAGGEHARAFRLIRYAPTQDTPTSSK